MIGLFGDIVFETSDKRILTFTDFKRDTASRWAKHDVIGQKPTTEFIGPDLDEITFTVKLVASLGVNPRKEAEKWLKYAREGSAETLVIGNKAMGVYKWTVQSASQMWNVVLNKGEVYSANVDISLQEYVKGRYK